MTATRAAFTRGTTCVSCASARNARNAVLSIYYFLCSKTRLRCAGLSPRNIVDLADVLVQGFFDYLAGHVAYDLLLHLATLENKQSRDTAYSVTLRSDRAGVHVHFADLHFARISGGHLVPNGRQCFAGTAPGSPEVDHDRLLALKHFLVKVGVGNFQNCSSCHENPFNLSFGFCCPGEPAVKRT